MERVHIVLAYLDQTVHPNYLKCRCSMTSARIVKPVILWQLSLAFSDVTATWRMKIHELAAVTVTYVSVMLNSIKGPTGAGEVASCGESWGRGRLERDHTRDSRRSRPRIRSNLMLTFCEALRHYA
jgi:hypothetical protein